MLDETTDVSHTEQASSVVSYIHEFEIKKRFLQVCNVDSTTGEELERVVTTLLEQNGLKIEDIVGQRYDGAANMRGQYRGLQARIRKKKKSLSMFTVKHTA